MTDSKVLRWFLESVRQLGYSPLPSLHKDISSLRLRVSMHRLLDLINVKVNRPDNIFMSGLGISS